ncbi:hypothetical protein JW899_01465 [Candidatus Uhrbacteria bacterium]|nr:hypothetical protein [Candidatus Uhrbacteria bacterium]
MTGLLFSFGVCFLGLLHAVLPIKQEELQAKLREAPYWKELYFSARNIAHYIASVKPMRTSKKTPVLGLFSTPFLIKNFSFLLSKSPIRFYPQNSIQISRRAKRSKSFKLAIFFFVVRGHVDGGMRKRVSWLKPAFSLP